MARRPLLQVCESLRMLGGVDSVTGQTYLGLCNGAIPTESLQFWTFAISIFVQACVLVVSFVSLFFPMTDLLHKIVAIEFAVQVVEFVWYFWIMSRWFGWFNQKRQRDSPVVLRYIDWAFSTPLMLCSILLALAFFQNDCARSAAVAEEFGWAFPILIVLDWAMLAAGAFVETRPKAIRNWSEAARVAILGAGTLPFIGVFILLFWLLGNDLYSDEGFVLLIITAVIWLLYGIVAAIAVAPTDNDENFAVKLVERAQIRNACYNILDLLSKNAMGIIITAITFARNGDGKGGDEICAPPSAPPPLAR